MTKLNNKISNFIFAASVAGLLLSIFHYHRESLKCFMHPDQQHYTEYTITCPVCALHVENDSDIAFTFDGFLETEQFIKESHNPLPLQEEFRSPLGRSPPFMI